jgi:hypothetical protein
VPLFLDRKIAGIAVPLIAAILVAAVGAGSAEPALPGDLNGDGQVTAADLGLLVGELCNGDPGAQFHPVGADANVDDWISAADLTEVVLLMGVDAPTPTPTDAAAATATPSPSATLEPIVTSTPSAARTVTLTSTPTATLPPPSQPPTPTPTATVTPTFTVTPTALPPCVVTDLGPLPPTSGTVTASISAPGTLIEGDCTRPFGSPTPVMLNADVYSVTSTLGCLLKITVVASGFTPYVAVVDGDPTHDVLEGPTPLEFTVPGQQPAEIRVTSSPSQPAAFGSYTVTVTQRACPP